MIRINEDEDEDRDDNEIRSMMIRDGSSKHDVDSSTSDSFESLSVKDCIYRGEGNANIVVSLPHWYSDSDSDSGSVSCSGNSGDSGSGSGGRGGSGSGSGSGGSDGRWVDEVWGDDKEKKRTVTIADRFVDQIAELLTPSPFSSRNDEEKIG
ncbi:hypothetical protein HZH66_010679 [Vespula vulgaris]|uniref:Uncharacterized protein n=1 Tax=Vespula vulgaris TaxID=7454 RepID=A0A834JIS4_VESVU|nr:hypothetical protein HZH66_010679 [Vespula vulgaris]